MKEEFLGIFGSTRILRAGALGLLAWVTVNAFMATPLGDAFLAPAAPLHSLPTARSMQQRPKSALELNAQGEELDKPTEKDWQRPFPKYAVGAGIFFLVVGAVGGGPILAGVFGFCGFAFGSLFEPFVTADGEISGLD